MLTLYEGAITVKRRLLQTEPGKIATPSMQQMTSTEDPLGDFRPKNDADYVARIRGKVMVKSRRHETLVRQFGVWAQTQDYECSTAEHPIDLLLRRDGRTWLVEAEVVRQGRAAAAVREAVGQLFEYRHFLYPPGSAPEPIALFSEPIGDAFTSYLEGLGITVVWKDGSQWGASPAELRT